MTKNENQQFFGILIFQIFYCFVTDTIKLFFRAAGITFRLKDINLL